MGEWAGSRFDELEVDNERWSWAMAVNPENIPEAMKKYPGSQYNERGQLLVRNRSEKLRHMKMRGMEEYN